MKPTNKRFAKIFDTIASKYDEVSNPYTVKRRIEFFKKNARGRCLEVGAATGKISLELSKKHRVVATDISPKMVEEIKKNKVKAVVCDAEKLPFPDKSFDTVISSEAIYYLDRPEKFIKEAYRVLRPHGRLLISSASENAKFYDIARAVLRRLGFKSMYFDDKNKNFMTKKSLQKLLSRGNFRILKINKTVIFPFSRLHFLNKVLENTYFEFFGCFIFVRSKKN